MSDDLTRQIERGHKTACGILAAIGVDMIEHCPECDRNIDAKDMTRDEEGFQMCIDCYAEIQSYKYDKQKDANFQKLVDHYSEGEDFNEPKREENDAQCASDMIDDQERAAIKHELML